MDLSSFDQNNITFSEAYTESKVRLKQFIKIANKLYITIVSISFTLLFSFLVILHIIAFQSAEAGMKVLVFILDAMVAYSVYDGITYFGKRAITMRRFAESNGFTFKPQMVIPKQYGELFRYGYAQVAKNGVQGEYGGIHFLLFDYFYTKGSPRYPTKQVFTILLLNIGAEVNHVLLKNKNGHLKSLKLKQPVLSEEIPGVSEHFTIYANEEDAKIVKRKLLHSDFITKIITASPKADVELKDGNTFIYLPGMVRDSETYRHLFSAIEKINR